MTALAEWLIVGGLWLIAGLLMVLIGMGGSE